MIFDKLKELISLKNIILLILLIALVITLSVMNTRLHKLTIEFSSRNDAFMAEISEDRETLNYLSNVSGMLVSDLTNTRESNGLPIRVYPERISEESDSISQDSASNEFLLAIDAFFNAENNYKLSVKLGKIINDTDFNTALNKEGVSMRKTGNNTGGFYKNGFQLGEIIAETEVYTISGFEGSRLDITSASNEAVSFIRDAASKYDKRLSLQKEMAANLSNSAVSEKVAQFCTEHDIRISIDDENNPVLIFSNKNNSNTLRAELTTVADEPGFLINNSYYSEDADISNIILSQLQTLDLRSAEEVLIQNAQAKIEDLQNDSVFQSYLESLDLTLNFIPREDNDYYYYDLIKADGSRLGSFSVLKKLGDIYLVDADEVPISSLKTVSIKSELKAESKKNFIIPENISSVNDIYSSRDSITCLLVGMHEKNTDTMIIVHADKSTGKAYLIGIPRDLYWKGRRVNSIYQYYGPEQLKKELSTITGLDISRYVIVDMYAFIDIVNILGGIDITLNEDLIDPTYRIRENGEWSTLNYKAGDYSLNGVEALRVARSRHGSNDFNRSERQQMIIEGAVNKFQQLRVTDAAKVYSLINAFFNYVDTDFSPVEFLSLYSNFGNSQLAGKHVLSFDNILYDTYSSEGAWILLPENDDWNVIRWYVRKIIQGEL